MKPCWINISGGEPMLNRELEAMLSFLVDTKRPLLITLTTNGLLDCSPMLRRVMARNRSSILYTSLSMDGHEAAHNLARGHAHSHQRVSRTYANLRALQRSFPRLKVGISTTVSRVNLAQILPFIEDTLGHCPELTLNLAQASDYYQNAAPDGFHALPQEELVGLLRSVQLMLPKLSLDSFLKINFLEMAIRHVQGRYAPIPCTSYLHNVPITAELDLVDCTIHFRPWRAVPDHDTEDHAKLGAGAQPRRRLKIMGALSSVPSSRESKLATIVAAIRQPRARRAALRAQIRSVGCEQACHTPCEKFVHMISALLNPRYAPRLLWTYLVICGASAFSRRRHPQRALHASRKLAAASLSCSPERTVGGGAARVAVIIPCLNEALTIAHVVRSFRRVLPHATIVVVDNASTDATAAIALAAGATVLREPVRGKGHAVRRAFAEIDASIYLLVDGDGTYSADDAPLVLAPLLRGEVDVVTGRRFDLGSGTELPWLNRLGNVVLLAAFNLLFGARVRDLLTGYRGLSRDAVRAQRLRSTGFELETELTAMAVRHGMRCAEVPIRMRGRPVGSFSKIRVVRDGLRVLGAIGWMRVIPIGGVVHEPCADPRAQNRHPHFDSAAISLPDGPVRTPQQPTSGHRLSPH